MSTKLTRQEEREFVGSLLAAMAERGSEFIVRDDELIDTRSGIAVYFVNPDYIMFTRPTRTENLRWRSRRRIWAATREMRGVARRDAVARLRRAFIWPIDQRHGRTGLN